MRDASVLSLAACLALATLAPAAVLGQDDIEATPILRPSLEGVDPSVQELLNGKLRLLEAVVARSDAAPGELAAAYGELGRLYLVYHLPESAESCLVNARRLEPDRFAWAYLLGSLRQERGDFEEARELLERSRDLRPEDPAVTIRLAQLAFELGDLEGSRELYDTLTGVPGFAAAAHYGLGRIAASLGDFEAAVGYFEATVAEQPGASQARYQLAQAYRRLGRIELAREQLEARGRGQLSFPDPVMEQLGEGAQGAEIYLAAGRKARHEGDLATAVASFRRAVEEDPEDPAHRRILAATLQESGRIDEAIEVYREGLRLEPDNHTVLYNLASALLARGEVAQAEPLLRRVVELAPDNADGRVNLAAIYEQWGRLADADRLLQEAIALDPYDSDLLVRRAAVLTALGRAGEARGTLETLVEEDPEDAEALVELGSARAAQGAMNEAMAAWRGAAEVEGVEPQTAARARFQLGRALQQAGRPQEAADQMRRAVELVPDNRQLRAALAGALGGVSDFDGAAEQYAAALRIDPRDDGARFGRAISLLLAGREREARDHLVESVAAAPGSRPLKHLLARLLATASEAALRDGARALTMAREVFQAEQTLDHAETMAMAHAELGEFEAAVEWQGRIIERARSTGRAALVPRLEARREQFARGEAVRAPWLEGR